MRILVIGGTAFVGRAITDAAVAAGHTVTVFNRGKSAPEDFADVEQLIGDRNSDLSALEGDRTWDATIDVCAYWPAQVRSLLGVLGERAGHYTFISTISVYSDEIEPNFDESAPRSEPSYEDELKMELYGQLKVACEDVATELVGDRLLIIRPGFVVGPYDLTMRFPYWVERIASGVSPMASNEPEQPLQVVDARDLGAFTVLATAAKLVDTFHVLGPEQPITFDEVVDTIAAAVGVTAPTLRPVENPALPLQIPLAYGAMMQADPGKSKAAGMTWRPMTDTIQDTLDWIHATRAAGTFKPREGVGLMPIEERALLAD